MIKTEIVTILGKDYLHTYSDEEKLLLQTDTGKVYEDAIDLIDTTHTYEEQ